jgi:palmitoyltransferase
VYKVSNLLIFETFTFLATVSHFRTMCTDPGAVPRGTATKEAIEQLGEQLRTGEMQ